MHLSGKRERPIKSLLGNSLKSNDLLRTYLNEGVCIETFYNLHLQFQVVIEVGPQRLLHVAGNAA